MLQKIKTLSPFIQVVVLFLIGLISFVVISILATVLVTSIYPNVSAEHTEELQNNYPSLYMLIFFAPFQLGVLLIPSLIYWFCLRANKLSPRINFKTLSWSVLLFIVIVLLLPFFSEINHIFTRLFGVYDTLEAQKIASDKVLTQLVSFSNSSYLVGLLIIGIITGISEEFAFRGFLQHHIFHHTNRLDLAILGSALIFALLHFNYFQFLPLFIFGVVLAMIFHVTKSVWLGTFFHAGNNMLNVYWLRNDNFPNFLEEHSLIITIPSALVLMGLLYYNKKKFNL